MGVTCSVRGANYSSFQLHEEVQKWFSQAGPTCTQFPRLWKSYKQSDVPLQQRNNLHFTHMVLLRLDHVSNFHLGGLFDLTTTGQCPTLSCITAWATPSALTATIGAVMLAGGVTASLVCSYFMSDRATSKRKKTRGFFSSGNRARYSSKEFTVHRSNK